MVLNFSLNNPFYNSIIIGSVLRTKLVSLRLFAARIVSSASERTSPCFGRKMKKVDLPLSLPLPACLLSSFIRFALPFNAKNPAAMGSETRLDALQPSTAQWKTRMVTSRQPNQQDAILMISYRNRWIFSQSSWWSMMRRMKIEGQKVPGSVYSFRQPQVVHEKRPTTEWKRHESRFSNFSAGWNKVNFSWMEREQIERERGEGVREEM